GSDSTWRLLCVLLRDGLYFRRRVFSQGCAGERAGLVQCDDSWLWRADGLLCFALPGTGNVRQQRSDRFQTPLHSSAGGRVGFSSDSRAILPSAQDTGTIGVQSGDGNGRDALRITQSEALRVASGELVYDATRWKFPEQLSHGLRLAGKQKIRSNFVQRSEHEPTLVSAWMREDQLWRVADFISEGDYVQVEGTRLVQDFLWLAAGFFFHCL